MSDPFFANSLSIVRSDTGCIHLRLLDEDSNVVAVAAMSVDAVDLVCRAIRDHRSAILAEPELQRLAPAGRA